MNIPETLIGKTIHAIKKERPGCGTRPSTFILFDGGVAFLEIRQPDSSTNPPVTYKEDGQMWDYLNEQEDAY